MGFASSGFNIWKSYKARHCGYDCRTSILLLNSASPSCWRKVQVQDSSLGVSFFTTFLWPLWLNQIDVIFITCHINFISKWHHDAKTLIHESVSLKTHFLLQGSHDLHFLINSKYCKSKIKIKIKNVKSNLLFTKDITYSFMSVLYCYKL